MSKSKNITHIGTGYRGTNEAAAQDAFAAALMKAYQEKSGQPAPVVTAARRSSGGRYVIAAAVALMLLGMVAAALVGAQ